MKPLVILMFLAVPAVAQNQKILFPMLSEPVVMGAGGSSFQTILHSYLPSAPQSAEFIHVAGVSHGRVLLLPAESRFGYDLISHGADVPDDITQLPVVRERDLRTGLSTIIGMRAEPNYIYGGEVPPRFAGTWKQRNMLRIYDFDNTGRLEADIVYRVPAWSGTFAGPHVVVNRRDGDDETYPIFGEVMLDGPCVTNPQSNVCGSWDNIVVEIHPNDPSIRYFPMLSSTDNMTQYVTIRVPQ